MNFMSNLGYALVLVGVAALLSWPLGRAMTWVMSAELLGPRARSFTRRFAQPLEDQSWQAYCRSLLTFNALMFTVGFVILVAQGWLPLNPDAKLGLEPSLAFNTAASFTTNTNLQHYSGEQVLSDFSQTCALMWLQFVSAATGIAVLAAIARALAPTGSGKRMGNFHGDVARALVLLIPLALLLGFTLILLGVPMTYEGPAIAHTLEGGEQIIARGPVAAMVAIKQLGTNGGGFFGPNSTHPFENPGFASATIELLAILVLPMASVWMFGRITGRLRHAAILFAVMTSLLLATIIPALLIETQPNPALADLAVESSVGEAGGESLGNLEGKELRFGPAIGPMWAVVTTATSNGSVAAMHDSLDPMTGLLPLVGMWLNVTFGGVGVGMVNMLLYALVAVFIAGLMVGRTPEYLGKKIEAPEIKLAALALLLHPLLILGGTALFAASAWGADTVANPGSHGFTEILYEMSSAAANNGSGFEGLSDNTFAWNLATGLIMFAGRYLPILLPVAIAGFLATKRPQPETIGTFRTDTPLFGLVLLGTIVLLGALLFLPAAVLGPIAEQLSLGVQP